MKTPKKILCLSTTGMGNAILYTPVIRSLIANYPQSVIDLMVSNPAAKNLLEGYPGIRRIIYWPKKDLTFWKYIKIFMDLRGENYDLFIGSFLDKSMKVSFFAFLLNIPIRVGFSNGWWKILYTRQVRIKEQKHEVEYNLDLLKVIGVDVTDNKVGLFLKDCDYKYAEEYIVKNNARARKYIIGFHPGSGTDIGNTVKRWSIDKFAETADKLIETLNASVIIFGGKEEATLADTMISLMKNEPLSAVGNAGIRQTAALIGKCDLFVTNDSGLMHIAAALKVPVAAIFGPTLSWKNYPWQVKHRIISSNLACSPCYNLKTIACKNIRCLKEIKVSDVFKAAEKLVMEVTASQQEADGFPYKSVKSRKISIITPDFSHNCVGRAILIAELLKENNDVEIVGPAFGEKVWLPVRVPAENIRYKYLSAKKNKFYLKTAYKLAQSMINSDIIIVSKAVLPSIFIALLARVLNNAPIIIDIDDWELGFEFERFKSGSVLKKIKSAFNVVKLIVCEFIVIMIKNRVVSNTYLQKRFGGVIIPHTRDTQIFDPALYDKKIIRERLNIPLNKKIVLFLGTPREHKGINELREAFKKIDRDDTILMLVGFNLDDKYQKLLHDDIQKQLGDKCRMYEQQPFNKIPEFLVLADMVVIPQRKTYSSLGQIPAKLFDAMAMALPIVASRTNDIPEILKDCGWTYEPGNIKELTDKIRFVLANPELSRQKGKNARQTCVNKYSNKIMKSKIDELLNKVV